MTTWTYRRWLALTIKTITTTALLLPSNYTLRLHGDTTNAHKRCHSKKTHTSSRFSTLTNWSFQNKTHVRWFISKGFLIFNFVVFFKRIAFLLSKWRMLILLNNYYFIVVAAVWRSCCLFASIIVILFQI